MAACNGVNGHTMTESPMRNDILKGEWGFDGVGGSGGATSCVLGGVSFRLNVEEGPIPPAAIAVARRRGVSPHRVLLAWLRQQSPNIVPLAGASRPASIRDSAAGVVLTDQDLEDLRVVA